MQALATRSSLPEQFVVSRRAPDDRQDWSNLTIGAWHLSHDPSLPVIVLYDPKSEPIGWMLGYPVDDAGVLHGSPMTVSSLTVPASVDPDALERWVYGHGGRFAVVFVDDRLSRVYIDPCGSLSAVYAPALECVASTVTALPKPHEIPELSDLAALVGVPANGMYPLTLTRRKNVWRILPNHYLDLKTWRTARHWPSPFEPVGDLDDVAEKVLARTRTQIRALVDRVPVLLRLTAGYDTRLLLACARPWIDRITTVTVEHGPFDESAWLDCYVAARIARDHGIRHVVVPSRMAKAADLEEWLVRTGYNVGEARGWRACTTFKQMPAGHADLLGVGGELARRSCWAPTDNEHTEIHAARLVEMCHSGTHPLSVRVAEEWLSEQPFRNSLLALDLFYLEQRLGCWGGVYPYGFGHEGRFQFYPFCHRETVHAMLSLPAHAKRTDLLAKTILKMAWPELLQYPVNRVGGVQRVHWRWLRSNRLLREVWAKADRDPVILAVKGSRAIARKVVRRGRPRD